MYTKKTVQDYLYDNKKLSKGSDVPDLFATHGAINIRFDA